MPLKPGERRPLVEMLKRVYPFQAPTAAAKLILMQIANNKDLEAQVLSDAYEGLVTLSDAKHTQGGAGPTPHARTDTKVVVDPKETTNRQVEKIAALFTDLDWRDAVLPKRLTPLTYAAQLTEMFPDKNLVQQIRRAQIWHLDRKPSWKRLAHSLNGWLAKPTPEWEKNGQRSMFRGPVPQSEQQDYTKGVDENGNW
jgi:hypothetical protein